MDQPAQVHQLLLAFLRAHYRKGRNLSPFLFNLVAARAGIWYSLSGSSEQELAALRELHHLGLVYIKKPEKPQSKFCVTRLLHSFLLSEQPQESSSTGFIIVEANFKVYAYTNDELHCAVLRLFMREDYRFPNLLVGRLTRDSLKEAFSKRITAKQIMRFLQTHAHPQTRQEHPQHGLQDPGSISAVMGLARDKGLESLAQQLGIWEQEMNCI
jgi:transcription initiation factor TFIIH subunit 4